MNPFLVLVLQLRPDRLLTVGRAGVGRLETNDEAGELFLDPRAMMSAVIVEAEIGARTVLVL